MKKCGQANGDTFHQRPQKKDDGRKKGKCMGTGSTERKAAEKRQTTLAQECQNQSRGKVSEGQTQGV